MASAFRILGEGQLSLTKFLLVADRPVDLKDFRATLEHVLARTRPETDLYVFSNLSMDTLDYSGPTVNEGSKGVWLGSATRCASCPEFRPGTPRGVTDVRVFCGGLSRGRERHATANPTSPSALAPIPRSVVALIVLTMNRHGRREAQSASLDTFTRFEPAADIRGICQWSYLSRLRSSSMRDASRRASSPARTTGAHGHPPLAQASGPIGRMGDADARILITWGSPTPRSVARGAPPRAAPHHRAGTSRSRKRRARRRHAADCSDNILVSRRMTVSHRGRQAGFEHGAANVRLRVWNASESTRKRLAFVDGGV
jgi:hypothetical protein